MKRRYGWVSGIGGKRLVFPFKRKADDRIAGGGWRRSIADPLAKTKMISDGEMIGLLVSQAADHDRSGLPGDAYKELLKLQDQQAKALTTLVAAHAFGLLVYTGAVSGFSSSGLQLAKSSFSHAALVLMSGSSLWFVAAFSKLQFLKSWFSHMFMASAPGDRTVILLKYPAAFWYFQFTSGNRGYPRHIFPVRDALWSVLPLILLLLVIVLATLGATTLWIAVAIKVWGAAFPTPAAAKATVVACGLLMSLAGLAPRFGDLKRGYVHYGLTATLGAVREERRELARFRVARATLRLNSRPDA